MRKKWLIRTLIMIFAVSLSVFVMLKNNVGKALPTHYNYTITNNATSGYDVAKEGEALQTGLSTIQASIDAIDADMNLVAASGDFACITFGGGTDTDIIYITEEVTLENSDVYYLSGKIVFLSTGSFIVNNTSVNLDGITISSSASSTKPIFTIRQGGRVTIYQTNDENETKITLKHAGNAFVIESSDYTIPIDVLTINGGTIQTKVADEGLNIFEGYAVFVNGSSVSAPVNNINININGGIIKGNIYCGNYASNVSINITNSPLIYGRISSSVGKGNTVDISGSPKINGYSTTKTGQTYGTATIDSFDNITISGSPDISVRSTTEANIPTCINALEYSLNGNIAFERYNGTDNTLVTKGQDIIINNPDSLSVGSEFNPVNKAKLFLNKIENNEIIVTNGSSSFDKFTVDECETGNIALSGDDIVAVISNGEARTYIITNNTKSSFDVSVEGVNIYSGGTSSDAYDAINAIISAMDYDKGFPKDGLIGENVIIQLGTQETPLNLNREIFAFDSKFKNITITGNAIEGAINVTDANTININELTIVNNSYTGGMFQLYTLDSLGTINIINSTITRSIGPNSVLRCKGNLIIDGSNITNSVICGTNMISSDKTITINETDKTNHPTIISGRINNISYSLIYSSYSRVEENKANAITINGGTIDAVSTGTTYTSVIKTNGNAITTINGGKVKGIVHYYTNNNELIINDSGVFDGRIESADKLQNDKVFLNGGTINTTTSFENESYAIIKNVGLLKITGGTINYSSADNARIINALKYEIEGNISASTVRFKILAKETMEVMNDLTGDIKLYYSQDAYMPVNGDIQVIGGATYIDYITSVVSSVGLGVVGSNLVSKEYTAITYRFYNQTTLSSASALNIAYAEGYTLPIKVEPGVAVTLPKTSDISSASVGTKRYILAGLDVRLLNGTSASTTQVTSITGSMKTGYSMTTAEGCQSLVIRLGFVPVSGTDILTNGETGYNILSLFSGKVNKWQRSGTEWNSVIETVDEQIQMYENATMDAINTYLGTLSDSNLYLGGYPNSNTDTEPLELTTYNTLVLSKSTNIYGCLNYLSDAGNAITINGGIINNYATIDSNSDGIIMNNGLLYNNADTEKGTGKIEANKNAIIVNDHYEAENPIFTSDGTTISSTNGYGLVLNCNYNFKKRLLGVSKVLLKSGTITIGTSNIYDSSNQLRVDVDTDYAVGGNILIISSELSVDDVATINFLNTNRKKYIVIESDSKKVYCGYKLNYHIEGYEINASYVPNMPINEALYKLETIEGKGIEGWYTSPTFESETKVTSDNALETWADTINLYAKTVSLLWKYEINNHKLNVVFDAKYITEENKALYGNIYEIIDGIAIIDVLELDIPEMYTYMEESECTNENEYYCISFTILITEGEYYPVEINTLYLDRIFASVLEDFTQIELDIVYKFTGEINPERDELINYIKIDTINAMDTIINMSVYAINSEETPDCYGMYSLNDIGVKQLIITELNELCMFNSEGNVYYEAEDLPDEIIIFANFEANYYDTWFRNAYLDTTNLTLKEGNDISYAYVLSYDKYIDATTNNRIDEIHILGKSLEYIYSIEKKKFTQTIGYSVRSYEGFEMPHKEFDKWTYAEYDGTDYASKGDFLGNYIANTSTYDDGENKCFLNRVVFVEATFKDIQYTISFKVGSETTNVTGIYGDEINVPNNPTLQGKTFKGWFISNDGGTTLIGVALEFTTFIGESVTVYPKWADAEVETISLKTPYHAEYVLGEELDPNMTIEVTYDNGEIIDIDVTSSMVTNFQTSDKENNLEATISFEGKECNLIYSVVDKYIPTITVKPTTSVETYTPTLTLADVEIITTNAESSALGEYVWKLSTTSLNALENTYEMTFNPTDTIHYSSVTFNVTVNVNKADFASNPSYIVLASSYNATYNDTLESIALPDGWAFDDDATTKVGDYTNGETRAFNATFTSGNSNYNNGTGEVLVIVAKANPIVNPIFEFPATFYNTDSMPSISLSEDDTKGIITWRANQEYSLNSNNTFYWDYTPTNSNYNTKEGQVIKYVTKDEITGIVVTNQPTNLSYVAYSSFDTTGLVIKGEREDLSRTQELTNYSIEYTNGDSLKFGDNKVRVKYSVNDNDYYADITGIVVTKATYTLPSITFTDKVFDWDGEKHKIEISYTGSLPNGVSVEYTNNDKINAGIYEVVASFKTTDTNYNEITTTYKAKYTIVAKVLCETEGVDENILKDYKAGETLPIPIKEGYSFKGWYTNSDFAGEPITSIDSFKGNVELYAKFEKNSNGAVIAIIASSVGVIAAAGLGMFIFLNKKKKALKG